MTRGPEFRLLAVTRHPDAHARWTARVTGPTGVPFRVAVEHAPDGWALLARLADQLRRSPDGTQTPEITLTMRAALVEALGIPLIRLAGELTNVRWFAGGFDGDGAPE